MPSSYDSRIPIIWLTCTYHLFLIPPSFCSHTPLSAFHASIIWSPHPHHWVLTPTSFGSLITIIWYPTPIIWFLYWFPCPHDLVTMPSSVPYHLVPTNPSYGSHTPSFGSFTWFLYLNQVVFIPPSFGSHAPLLGSHTPSFAYCTLILWFPCHDHVVHLP